MASGTGSKCPICGRSVAVGLVSGTLLQHETKTGERCAGSGVAPAPTAAKSASQSRATASTRSAPSAAASRPSSGRTSTAAPKAGPVHKSLTVRRVEVDPEELARRQRKQEELREARAAAARDRNEIHVSYFDEPRP
jgi:hypothetical protein